MNEQPTPHAIYSICVRSILDESWVRALEVKAIATHRHYTEPPRTILILELVDQAELLGLINRIHNLGITILSFALNWPAHPGSVAGPSLGQDVL
jgi:hypothetical protein